MIDTTGRVKAQGWEAFPQSFCRRGAAVGISGTTAAGYLSGNGLLTATVLGRLTGQAAAALSFRIKLDPDTHDYEGILCTTRREFVLQFHSLRQGSSETMSVSEDPARPACVSHADNEVKEASFILRLYSRKAGLARKHR